MGDRQYRESLLATTCRRGAEWKSEGCTELPKAVAPDPIVASAVDVSIHSARPEKERKGHVLKVYAEYTAKQNIHAAYELAAEVACSAGSKTARFSDDVNGVDLNELRPSQRARGFIPEPYKEEEMLPVPPERCTLDFHLLKTMGPDEKLPITKSFCWEAGKPIRDGKCGPTK